MKISKLLENKKSLAKGLFAIGTAGFLVSVGLVTNSTQVQGARYGYGYGSTANSTNVNRLAVRRLWNSTVGDHLYTTNTSENPTGYTQETGDATFNGWDNDADEPAGGDRIYRAYSPLTGDHFYTADLTEYQNAVFNQGYRSEGTAFWAYENIADAPTAVHAWEVHRLYKASIGDHFYTRSDSEKTSAIAAGWVSEGVGFATPQNQPV